MGMAQCGRRFVTLVMVGPGHGGLYAARPHRTTARNGQLCLRGAQRRYDSGGWWLWAGGGGEWRREEKS